MDGQTRQTLGDVAALASHGFDEGDEGWVRPLLSELELRSGDETATYRLLMFGLFVAAGLTSPGRKFKSIFGDKVSGWSLSLPAGLDQRRNSLDNLRWLFKALVDNDAVIARRVMIIHLDEVQRVPRCTGWASPSRIYPVSYLLYFGRLEGPE